MNKGRLFIISGPSGSGKDTMINKIREHCPNLKFSISSITRPMRPGEVEGGKYHFISREEFEQMINNDQLLEYNCFVGNYYGTPKQPVLDAINAGEDILVEVDVNGAAKIRQKLPEAISVFILPPSYEVLKKRLCNRGTDAPEIIEKRLSEALGEIKRATEYTYTVINDNLDTAVSDFISIINSDKTEIKDNTKIINEVLEKC